MPYRNFQLVIWCPATGDGPQCAGALLADLGGTSPAQGQERIARRIARDHEEATGHVPDITTGDIWDYLQAAE